MRIENYTVNSGTVAGIRWFELRNVTNGPVIVNQESTYQPITSNRAGRGQLVDLQDKSCQSSSCLKVRDARET